MGKMNRGFFGSTRADYETPQPLFDALNKVFAFGLDVCADERNAKVANYLSKEDDGLAVHWRDRFPEDATQRHAWMNPEYGTVVPAWTAKALEESKYGVSTVALLGSRTDAGWFHDDVARANWVLFLKGRVKFLLPCTLCGKSTVKRRRPSTYMLTVLEDAGAISYETHGDLSESGTLPVCDACRTLDVANWGKSSANSPAMGSMLVGWGFEPWKVDALATTSLYKMGVLVRPQAWVISQAKLEIGG